MEVERVVLKRKAFETDQTMEQRNKKPSLLVKAMQLKAQQQVDDDDDPIKQERQMIADVSERSSKTLMSVHELAKGIIKYTDPLWTGWKPPLAIRRMSQRWRNAIRKMHHIAVDGEDVPPPVKSFEGMRLPKAVVRQLKEKGIVEPTPIQVQGLPVVLSGRDMIGIASTGLGKTLVFVLPLVLLCLQEELMMPVFGGEGPLGLIICPSRELATQTYEVIRQCLGSFMEGGGYPRLRPMLCIGGTDMRSQEEVVRKGVHIVVATPGRLKDMLAKKKMNLDHCRYLCLDEADRLVDFGFEDDIKEVLDRFKAQRQTVLFSATMPTKVQVFAKSALVKPVVVNASRPGAANLDVVQEVEYVKQEAKTVHLLECLQKTQPPIVVFCKNKAGVDHVFEYLLLKGVEAVAIHGGKDQEEREYAIKAFRGGKKDVLVATDVASKGLDFPDIQHVINYDMPREIENYVHRIGRTGRGGKTGVATTFINGSQSETTLLDLKRLLQEAKQRIPPALAALEDDQIDKAEAVASAAGGVKGCAYCGGLGHRISNCAKLEQHKKQLVNTSTKDYFGGGGYKGEI